MKRIDKLFACSLAITVFASCQIHAQDGSSFVDEYLQQFLSALSITESTNTTNSTIWTPPESFLFGGMLFSVSSVESRTPELCGTFNVAAPENNMSFSVNCYQTSSQREALQMLGVAMGVPSTISPDGLAASYSTTNISAQVLVAYGSNNEGIASEAFLLGQRLVLHVYNSTTNPVELATRFFEAGSSNLQN